MSSCVRYQGCATHPTPYLVPAVQLSGPLSLPPFYPGSCWTYHEHITFLVAESAAPRPSPLVLAPRIGVAHGAVALGEPEGRLSNQSRPGYIELHSRLSQIVAPTPFNLISHGSAMVPLDQKGFRKMALV